MTDLMPEKVRLSSPRLRVVFGDRTDPDTWEALEVQTTGTDMQAAEQVFARHKLGKIQDRPVKFQWVLAWSALRATDVYAGSLAQFEQEVLEVGDPTPDNDDEDTADADLDDGGIGVDPTSPAAGPA